MSNDSLLDLLPEFMEESYDNLVKVQAALKALATSEAKEPLIEELFRGIHTIKGGCGMIGFNESTQVAHRLEAELGKFRTDTVSLSAERLSSLQRDIDQFEEIFKAEAAVLQGKASAPVQPETTAAREAAPMPAELSKVEAPTEATSAAAPIVAARASAAPPSQAPANPVPQTQGAPTPPTTSAPKQVPAEVLRVPLPLVSSALNNVWEVFLIRNQLAYLFEQEKAHLKHRVEFLQTWELLDSTLKRNVSELESAVMAMRMSNLKGLFSRMEKVVRSYLDSNREKQIIFETGGDSTELDKKVIDMLGDPLIHLIRNAMDHGVETMLDRATTGKSPQGRIRLSAEAMADRVLVKIEDDGKGIDGTKLIQKAEAKGLDVSVYKSGAISPIEIIFLAGFSTAEKVTEVSGRGVGMDAVKHSIQELGGSIEIETQVGKGSTFSIYLPLSLSVIPATVYHINSHLFGSNVNSIIEICRVPESEIKKSNGASHFYYRDRYIPCFDLRKHLLSGAMSSAFPKESEAEASLFVIQIKSDLLAVRVSDVVENTEVVVKPLPALLPRYSFIQGMSILPTGQAIFILSFDRLIEATRSGRLEKFVNPSGGAIHDAA